ncbi:hypothetical protein QT973_10965 [Microcoleus sp. Z1_A1]|uniref:hypothetical protein n=1 Tax=Microcoleus sp. Z1_A1 TaxID=3055428 RepID=UPI002FD2C2C6
MNNSDANGFDITENQDTPPCRFSTINPAVVKFVFTWTHLDKETGFFTSSSSANEVFS